MNRRVWMIVTLAGVNAFSAAPSAFYAQVSVATGTPWSTALLFSGHGAASILGMSAAAAMLARRPHASQVAPLAAALAADVAGGILLLLAVPDDLALLAVGRVVCGAALGVVSTLVAASIVRAPGGSAVVTAAVFGGVGAGSVLSGILVSTGAGAVGALALGLAALGALCIVAPWVRGDDDSVAGRVVPLRRAETGIVVTAAAALSAFASNGVLALFTSLLPGEIARMTGGTGAVAGLVAGTAMLAAGAARLLIRTARLGAVIPVGVTVGVTVVIAGVLVSGVGGTILAVAGGVLLGAVAGLTYDAALRAVRGADARVATVQRSGQAGLVVPPLLLTAVIAR